MPLRRILHVSALLSATLLWAVAAGAHAGYTAAPDNGSSKTAPTDFHRTDLFNEGFETSVPPTGWAVIHLGASYTWAQTSSAAHGGTYSAWLHYGPQGIPQDEYLVTPAIDLSAIGAAYLEFFEDQAYWPGYGDHHYLGVSTTSQTDPAAFTFIADWTPANHTIDEGFAGDPVTVSLADYVGQSQVYLCFRYTGEYADDWYIDDVRIYEPFAHDVAILDITPNDEQFTDGLLITPQVTVENKGANPESVDVRLVITESGLEVYNTLLTQALAVGEILALPFPDFTAVGGNYYHLNAEAVLPGDMDTTNNTRENDCNSYTQSHVPLGWLHTNAGCGYCAPANVYLDNWQPGQGDSVALIRTHTWWPNPADILYLQNAAQNQSLVQQWGYDYTPHFWLDGDTDAGSASADYTSLFEARKLVLSPGCIELTWRAEDSTAVACVQVREALDPHGDYRLKLCVTEDDYYYAGGNGHNTHHQALRRMLPGVGGVTIAPGVDTLSVEVPVAVATYWTLANLNLTAFLQDDNTWHVWQAVTGSLDSLSGHLRVEPPASELQLGESLTLAIDIEPTGADVKSVEAIIDFDESVVRLDSITPGAWVTAAGLAFDFFDYTAGDSSIAHFSLAFLAGGRSGDGSAALCHFTGLAEGATSLDWILDQVRDLNDIDLGYLTSSGDSILVINDLTPVAEGEAAPASLRLLGNTPNPFNPSTLIRFELPEAGAWTVAIFDVRGRRVRELQAGWLTAGGHALRWDGSDDAGETMGSGVYLLRVSGPAGSRSGKLVLLK